MCVTVWEHSSPPFISAWRSAAPCSASTPVDKSEPEPRGGGSVEDLCFQPCRKIQKNLSVSVCPEVRRVYLELRRTAEGLLLPLPHGHMAQKPDPRARDSPHTNGHPRAVMPCRRRRFCRNKVGTKPTNPARLAYPYRFCLTILSVCGSPQFLTASDRYHTRKSPNSMPH